MMIPGTAKRRDELPWLPYPDNDRVIINPHRFDGGGGGPTPLGGEILWLMPDSGITDLSGNGNDGTYNGGMGVSGGEYVFDGVNDEITTPVDIAGASAAAISFWFKKTLPTNKMCIGQSQDAGGMHIIWWNTGTFYLTGGGGATSFRANNSTLHHACLVFDGSGATNADRLKFYLDGSASTLTFGGSIGTTLGSPTGPLQVGRYAINSNWTSGSMNDVRVFQRAISSAEVTTLYNSGTPGVGA